MSKPETDSRRSRAAPAGPSLATVAQLSEFDEIIDVRSEDEFAEDHIPGAVNCPALYNAQRAQVGTIYKQVSSFEAKKVGAAYVSANIARHLQDRFKDRPRGWKPLVYCWRGGERSAAVAHVLQRVGWRVGRLDGGYKAYRRVVVSDLRQFSARFRWRVVCGLTGTGKSRLLRALGKCGGQVLDLEALAAHRGSVLGNLPGEPQPSQKTFESRIWDAFRGFAVSRPVYVEAESRKIGDLRVPEGLIDAMWHGECVLLQAPLPQRVLLLRQEYAHFLDCPERLISKLECLTGFYGYGTIEKWKTLAVSGRWDDLIQDLLIKHYDPAYSRSTLKHYPALEQAPALTLRDVADSSFLEIAQQCLAGKP